MQSKANTTERLNAQPNLTPRSVRTARGGLVLELGPTLWLLFLMLVFPLLDLGTVAMRYTFLLGASRDAAEVACTAKTFLADFDATHQSAVNSAAARANANISAFKGVKLISVQTNIVTTNLTTKKVTTQSTPLTAPADPSTNMYQIQVIVKAQAEPLIPYVDGLMPKIPGLSTPATFTVVSDEYCENTSGLVD